MSRISMSSEELDQFLQEETVLHMATAEADGWPAVVPVWFVWHDRAFWIWNLNRAKRTQRLARPETRAAVVVDGGAEYTDLRGYSARVKHEFIEFEESPLEVRVSFARRYLKREEPLQDKDDHTWLKLTPLGGRTWDFRKM